MDSQRLIWTIRPGIVRVPAHIVKHPLMEIVSRELSYYCRFLQFSIIYTPLPLKSKPNKQYATKDFSINIEKVRSALYRKGTTRAPTGWIHLNLRCPYWSVSQSL